MNILYTMKFPINDFFFSGHLFSCYRPLIVFQNPCNKSTVEKSNHWMIFLISCNQNPIQIIGGISELWRSSSRSKGSQHHTWLPNLGHSALKRSLHNIWLWKLVATVYKWDTAARVPIEGPKKRLACSLALGAASISAPRTYRKAQSSLQCEGWKCWQVLFFCWILPLFNQQSQKGTKSLFSINLANTVYLTLVIPRPYPTCAPDPSHFSIHISNLPRFSLWIFLKSLNNLPPPDKHVLYLLLSSPKRQPISN